MLKPEYGVPMEDLKGKLSLFRDYTSVGHRSGLVRGSPTKYPEPDGEVIAAAIRDAEANPVCRPVDPRMLKRSSNLYKLAKR